MNLRSCLFVLAASLQACNAAEGSWSTLPTSSAHAARLQLPAPGETPDKTWSFGMIDGALCGNGNDTGIAVSPVSDSNVLFVWFEGGGACDDDETCRRMMTTSYVQSGYTEKDFTSSPVEKALLEDGWLVTSRKNANNPFRDVNMAYIPYCTGDVHAGDNVVTYDGAPAPTYHVGMRNTKLYFAALAQRFPNVQRVWLSGFSAGGFAAAFHRDTAADAFTDATIYILDDSGLSYAGAPAHPSWNIQYPEGCTGCAEDFSTIMDYYATTAPESRFALITYEVDSVLPFFFQQSYGKVAADITAYARRMQAYPNVATFVAPGVDHVVMQNPWQISGGNVSLARWITQMESGDPAWHTRRPSRF